MKDYDSVFEYIKHNKKTSFIIFLILVIITLSLSLYIKCKEKQVVKYKTKEVYKECKKEDNKKLIVDIKGCIKKPGIYEVDEGTRISDVINLAGGLLGNANTRYLNLSKKVTDELVIVVYSNSEIEKMLENEEIKEELPELEDENIISEEKTEKNENDTNSLININTASLEELMQLSGIGESKAKAIIEYRNKSKFKNIEEIKEVSGIGEAIFEKIKNNITV